MKKYRVPAILLCFVLLASLLPLFSFAAEEPQMNVTYRLNDGDHSGSQFVLRADGTYDFDYNTASGLGIVSFSGKYTYLEGVLTLEMPPDGVIREPTLTFSFADGCFGQIRENDYGFTARYVPQQNEPSPARESLFFGSYPRSRVTDPAVIAALDPMAEGAEWISFGLRPQNIGQGTAAPVGMYYTDVQVDGARYRGLKIEEHLPSDYLSLVIPEFDRRSDTSRYPTGVFWFRYDPIEWNVTDEAEGLLISAQILDARQYNAYLYGACTVDPAGFRQGELWCDEAMTLSPNNYGNSSVHAWLNGEFLQTAFPAGMASYLLPMEIDTDYTAFGSGEVTPFPAVSALVTLPDNAWVYGNLQTSYAQGPYSEKNTAAETPYAALLGGNVGSEAAYGYWWCRNAAGEPGEYKAAVVDAYGAPSGSYPQDSVFGVRPQIRVSAETLQALRSGTLPADPAQADPAQPDPTQTDNAAAWPIWAILCAAGGAAVTILLVALLFRRKRGKTC